MEDLNGLEAVIRRIAREEITRAMGAAGAVAEGAMEATGGSADISRGVIASVMGRVARDVLADKHPALEREHTCTLPVHTITTVPERSRAACTCIRHTHVMGNGNWCGHEGCFCRTPVRARVEHTDEHASTEPPRTCPTCSHGVHEPGKCSMHVYRRGTPIHCPCVEWVRPEAVVGAGARRVCTLCLHAPHGAGDCPGIVAAGGACTCSGKQDVHVVSTAQARKCSLCLHPEHDQSRCPYAVASGTCLCTGRASTSACSYCNHDHGGPLEDCPARVGKQQCSCPYVGGRR